MNSKYKIAGLLVILAVLGFGIYMIVSLNTKNSALALKLQETEESLKTSNENLTKIETEKNNLINAVNEASARNASFAAQIDKITQTVEGYERLKQIDPELLQKYSKVFFLSEHYKPSQLTVIDTKYLYNKSKPLEFHDRAWPFLRDMFIAAAADGIDLQVISAYRSFGTQATLKANYKVIYGAGTANQFSADQGYSEHQLGTTLDLTSTKIGGNFETFAKTEAYTWMQNNAYKYGFSLSYPPNNKYYVFEPWHWRFVGLDLALKLHNENKYFYDLEQREINSYLITLFNTTVTPQSTTSVN